MSGASAKKLPKAERRDQLLDTALTIVREEGTDALTLGYLAERAGVSKPIAYEHFKTRSGLLIALYERHDDQQTALVRQALAQSPRRLEDTALIISQAYMDCYTASGPEWHAIAGALKGDEEMEAFYQKLLDRCATFYCEVFSPYAQLTPPELRLRSIAILGAGEAISREMVKGHTSHKAAVEALASLIIAWLAD